MLVKKLNTNGTYDYAEFREGQVYNTDVWTAVDESEMPDAVKAIIQQSFTQNRNGILADTDYMMTSDYQALLSETQRADVLAYRQALRDATDSWTLPKRPEWMA